MHTSTKNYSAKSSYRKKGGLKINSFFAGIGGFDIAFEKAGFVSDYQCEIDPFCNSVLERHWPNVLRSEDINKVIPEEIPVAEVWCGGFPCQDLSVARGWLGRDGLKGKNSGLFHPFMKLIEARLPKVVLLENVMGLLSAHDGRDFVTVLESLTSLGYGVAWRVMNTRYFGAPQSRPRVYVCAWLNDLDAAINALYEPQAVPKPSSARLGFLSAASCPATGAVVPEVAYCLAATSGRHTGTDWSRSYVSYFAKVRRLTPNECEGLQGFPKKWSVPSNSFHESENEIDARRYHALGNAVSVPVASWIAKRIFKELHSKKSTVSFYNAKKDTKEIFEKYPIFDNSKIRRERLDELAKSKVKIKWQSGGFAIGGFCFDCQVAPCPVQPIKSRFVDVIEKQDVDNRYFLSPNAAKGILRRVSSQNRTLFEPLQIALENLAASDFQVQRSRKVKNGLHLELLATANV